MNRKEFILTLLSPILAVFGYNRVKENEDILTGKKCGYRGYSEEIGFFYCPYVPLVMTKIYE